MAPSTLFPNTQQPCKFFELPPELRNVIYEMILPEDGPIDITIHFRCPPLLRTCVQISLEAAPMYYGRHNFYCRQYNFPDDDVEDFIGLQWLQSLGEWRRSKLTRVCIEHGFRHPVAQLGRKRRPHSKLRHTQRARDDDKIFQRTLEYMWWWLDKYAPEMKAGVVSITRF